MFEPRPVGRQQADAQVNRVIRIVALQDFAVLIQPGEPRSILGRQAVVELFHPGCDPAVHRRQPAPAGPRR